MKFKVGDRVERIKSSHVGMRVGDIATVKSSGEYSIGLKEYAHTHDPDKFKLVKGKKGRPPKEKQPEYIVMWCEDEDPAEVFYSKKEAIEKVKELHENSSVVKSSITVYKIEKTIKPKVEVKF